MNRACKVCGRYYEDRGSHSGIRRDVCSRSCQQKRAAANAKRTPRVCRCGVEFMPTNGAQKHCSATCRRNAEQKYQRQCRECGVEFATARPTARFCTPLCANRATAAKRKGRSGRFGMGSVAKYPRPARCFQCGATFQQRAAVQRFCSRSCGNTHRHAERRKGAAPPWSVKSKGEAACRNCGERATHLHHIVPRSKSAAGKRDVERNGLPLCRGCHYGWHHRTVTIYGALLDEQEYARAVQLAGPLWVEQNYPPTPDETMRNLAAVQRGLHPRDAWTLCADAAGGIAAVRDAQVRVITGNRETAA